MQNQTMAETEQHSAHQRMFLSLADTGPVEEEAVNRAMHSGWIAPLGPEVDAFEQEMAERVGVTHALALNSGTAALHLALLGAGASAGTVVPVASLTFAATTNAIAYTGAEPYFVDAAADGNINPQLLLDAVDELQAAGETVPAVVTVDLMGRSCDYAALEAPLAERGVTLIEDAAEALGASVDGQRAGSFGKAAALSFNGNKIMTTSGGGMLLSDDGEFIARARYLSTQARQPVAWYEHTDIGYNYRLSGILAALGRAQLSRLDGMMAVRRRHRDRYLRDLVPQLGRLLGDTDSRFTDNCWLTTVVLDPDSGWTRDSAIEALNQENIEARHLWKPMHLQPVYAGARAKLDGTAEDLFARSVTLPSGSVLSDEDIDRVIAVLSRKG